MGYLHHGLIHHFRSVRNNGEKDIEKAGVQKGMKGKASNKQKHKFYRLLIT